MCEDNMEAFGDVVDVRQASSARTITPNTFAIVNFVLVLRDLRKDRLEVGVNRKRNAW